METFWIINDPEAKNKRKRVVGQFGFRLPMTRSSAGNAGALARIEREARKESPKKASYRYHQARLTLTNEQCAGVLRSHDVVERPQS